MVANMKVVSVPFGTREHELSLETTGSPTFHPSRPTKIIISPGHNGGWVSHAPPEAPDAFLAWMITYEPLIEALEKRYTRGMSTLMSLQNRNTVGLKGQS